MHRTPLWIHFAVQNPEQYRRLVSKIRGRPYEQYSNARLGFMIQKQSEKDSTEILDYILANFSSERLKNMGLE